MLPGKMEPKVGFEPTASRLRNGRSVQTSYSGGSGASCRNRTCDLPHVKGALYH